VNVPAFARPGPGQKSPSPPRVQAPTPVSKRGGRRSAPAFDDVTQTVEAPRPRRGSATNEMRKRGRGSRPSSDEGVHVEVVASRPQSSEELEAWPIQSISEDEEQHTRIGTPAYHEGAQRASARPAAMPPELAPLVMSQAVRVVVWRGADGAPAGTQVTAIGVEAVLVALDPVADLAAWLSNK
jgi:hypothetical protein